LEVAAVQIQSLTIQMSEKGARIAALEEENKQLRQEAAGLRWVV
jgi:hypothetical protein